jgi:hypothetical protein
VQCRSCGAIAQYDLSDRGQRARAYEPVLREGTAEDVRYFVDVDDLLDVWDELVLPPAVSRAWIDWLAKHRHVVVVDCRDRACTADDPTAGR